MKVKTINPSNENILAEYDIMNKEQVNFSVKKSKNTFTDWKKNMHQRTELIHRFAEELRKNKKELALVASNEMGKPIKEAISEIEKCAVVMEYYGDNGQIFINDEVLNTDARKTLITFQPLGVIASIMPWNFPYWQALRFAAPSMIIGNTVVLKPASATLQCGIEIEKLFTKVGFPDGVFQTLVGDSTVAEHLIDSADVNAVTFTGSTSVGAKVAQKAGMNLKKCVLELGGSDPFIVCGDADLEKAAEGAVKGRFINCGQSCIASKRFFVTSNVADEFIEKFVQKTERLRVGNPISEDTDIGPLVNSKGLETIVSQVKDAANNGAEILTGGERVGDKGYYYKPTIIKNISNKMRMYHEETFGPVASIVVVEDEKNAIRLANESSFGLGASVWTKDLDKAEQISRDIESGMVSVNNMLVSDPRVPFGGIKQSGFGRELSKYGMLEFVNIKSIRFYDQLSHNHHVE
ncbi:MAG: succinate-semialdehyde dehydrogenase [Nitrosopumilales archaeon CG_4_10_14_0_8_um_filter_34_8]|nr:MAG: succinate-semialdehyde dehydrogenase [Nitrosopumilales archaeon CG_4_10_14_0_8_um_filter_34_8]